MTESRNEFTVELLLAQVGWLQALTLDLVRDPDLRIRGAWSPVKYDGTLGLVHEAELRAASKTTPDSANASSVGVVARE